MNKSFDNIMRDIIEYGEALFMANERFQTNGVMWYRPHPFRTVECSEAFDANFIDLADPASIDILRKAYISCCDLESYVDECPFWADHPGDLFGRCWRKEK